MSSDAAKDREFKSDEISCYAIGKSGKVKCVKSGKDGEKDPKKDQSFQLEVDYVKQFDESGNQVGKPVNTLASQEFTITELNKDGSYQGKFDKQRKFNINIFQRFLPQTCLNF